MDDERGMTMETVVEHGEVVVFSTHIRERPVTCRWERSSVSGDAELLDRMSRLAPMEEWSGTPESVARMISGAVPSPVVIRILAPDGR